MQQCIICGRQANHHIALDSGEKAHYCWPCFGVWECNRRALDPSRYSHPEKIVVSGKTFSVYYHVYSEGIRYYAVGDSKKTYLIYSCLLPFEMDGMSATAHLRNIVAEALKKKALSKDGTLEDEGFIDIWYSEGTSSHLAIIIDGKRYSIHDFIEMLQARQAWRMHFSFEDTYPQPESEWFLIESHMPKDDLKSKQNPN